MFNLFKKPVPIKSILEPQKYEVSESRGCMGTDKYNTRIGTRVCLFQQKMQNTTDTVQFIRLKFEDGSIGEYPWMLKDWRGKSHATFYHDKENNLYTYSY